MTELESNSTQSSWWRISGKTPECWHNAVYYHVKKCEDNDVKKCSIWLYV